MTQKEQDYHALWTLGACSLSGTVIGTVLADEIINGKTTLAVLLVISIFVLTGYKGTSRITRLVITSIIAAIFMMLILIAYYFF